MSTINELLAEIEALNKKNKEESRKRLKRKLQIDDEINRLEEEKRRAGLRYDSSSVVVFNSQIKMLEQEKSHDYDFEYEEKIKRIKEKISNLIVDYYKEGYVIDDIFLKENIPENIQKEWLDLGDFGKNTGYLFVESLEKDEVYNWRYINPVTNFEIKIKNLNDLNSKCNYYNKIFLIFDNDLAKKSKNKENSLYKMKIDSKLDELDELRFGYSDARKILECLEKFADFFSVSQINRLCEISINNSQVYNCFICTSALRNILTKNKDNIDSELYEEAVLKNEL